MKFTFKKFNRQDSGDIWEDTTEKRSLAHVILDLPSPLHTVCPER